MGEQLEARRQQNAPASPDG